MIAALATVPGADAVAMTFIICTTLLLMFVSYLVLR